MEKRKMTALRVVILPLLAIFITGCFHNVKTVPQTPVEISKAEFLNNYGFFITPEEKKKGYPELENPVKPFEKIDTLEELNRFEEHFLKIRDTDPNTPENEFKELIDSRIQDIKNETFLSDPDTAGTSFERNGGLKGDMARVYLLYGMPHYKAKLAEGGTYHEMMVWYYFDSSGHTLFRFLFINKYGGFRLFKNYGAMIENYLFDPTLSPLKEISNRWANSPQEMFDIWDELNTNDVGVQDINGVRGAFVAALLQFSYYTEDVVIEGGDGHKKLGALDPPKPAAFTAKRFKSKILGQPEDLTGRDVVLSKYHSFIPLYVRVVRNSEGNPSISLNILESNLDWEIKNDKAESALLVRLNFYNKTTGMASEFLTQISINLNKEKLGDRSKSIAILLDNSSGKSGNEPSPVKFSDFAKKLSPGEYLVDIYVSNPLTKKNNAWPTQTFIK